MGEQVTNVTIYSDYLCPWCYVAFVRLQRLKEEYGENITLTWKSFPLRPYETQGPPPSYLNRAIAAAAEKEKSIHFKPWPASLQLPKFSMPALEASKCVQQQGTEDFERYHLLLFKSYFEQSKDISKYEVLYSLAQEAKLDTNRFALDFNNRAQRDKVMDEYHEARDKHHVMSIPAVLFENCIRFDCAVPLELYRSAVELCLSE